MVHWIHSLFQAPTPTPAAAPVAPDNETVMSIVELPADQLEKVLEPAMPAPPRSAASPVKKREKEKTKRKLSETPSMVDPDLAAKRREGAKGGAIAKSSPSATPTPMDTTTTASSESGRMSVNKSPLPDKRAGAGTPKSNRKRKEVSDSDMVEPPAAAAASTLVPEMTPEVQRKPPKPKATDEEVEKPAAVSAKSQIKRRLSRKERNVKTPDPHVAIIDNDEIANNEEDEDIHRIRPADRPMTPRQARAPSPEERKPLVVPLPPARNQQEIPLPPPRTAELPVLPPRPVSMQIPETQPQSQPPLPPRPAPPQAFTTANEPPPVDDIKTAIGKVSSDPVIAGRQQQTESIPLQAKEPDKSQPAAPTPLAVTKTEVPDPNARLKPEVKTKKSPSPKLLKKKDRSPLKTKEAVQEKQEKHVSTGPVGIQDAKLEPMLVESATPNISLNKDIPTADTLAAGMASKSLTREEQANDMIEAEKNKVVLDQPVVVKQAASTLVEQQQKKEDSNVEAEKVKQRPTASEKLVSPTNSQMATKVGQLPGTAQSPASTATATVKLNDQQRPATSSKNASPPVLIKQGGKEQQQPPTNKRKVIQKSDYTISGLKKFDANMGASPPKGKLDAETSPQAPPPMQSQQQPEDANSNIDMIQQQVATPPTPKTKKSMLQSLLISEEPSSPTSKLMRYIEEKQQQPLTPPAPVPAPVAAQSVKMDVDEPPVSVNQSQADQQIPIPMDQKSSNVQQKGKKVLEPLTIMPPQQSIPQEQQSMSSTSTTKPMAIPQQLDKETRRDSLADEGSTPSTPTGSQAKSLINSLPKPFKTNANQGVQPGSPSMKPTVQEFNLKKDTTSGSVASEISLSSSNTSHNNLQPAVTMQTQTPSPPDEVVNIVQQRPDDIEPIMDQKPEVVKEREPQVVQLVQPTSPPITQQQHIQQQQQQSPEYRPLTIYPQNNASLPRPEKKDRDSKVIKAAAYWNNYIGEVLDKKKLPDNVKSMEKPKKIISAGVGPKGMNDLKLAFERQKSVKESETSPTTPGGSAGAGGGAGGPGGMQRRNSKKMAIEGCTPGLKVTDAKSVFEMKNQPTTPVIYRRNPSISGDKAVLKGKENSDENISSGPPQPLRKKVPEFPPQQPSNTTNNKTANNTPFGATRKGAMSPKTVQPQQSQQLVNGVPDPGSKTSTTEPATEDILNGHNNAENISKSKQPATPKIERKEDNKKSESSMVRKQNETNEANSSIANNSNNNNNNNNIVTIKASQQQPNEGLVMTLEPVKSEKAKQLLIDNDTVPVPETAKEKQVKEKLAAVGVTTKEVFKGGEKTGKPKQQAKSTTSTTTSSSKAVNDRVETPANSAASVATVNNSGNSKQSESVLKPQPQSQESKGTASEQQAQASTKPENNLGAIKSNLKKVPHAPAMAKNSTSEDQEGNAKGKLKLDQLGSKKTASSPTPTSPKQITIKKVVSAESDQAPATTEESSKNIKVTSEDAIAKKASKEGPANVQETTEKQPSAGPVKIIPIQIEKNIAKPEVKRETGSDIGSTVTSPVPPPSRQEHHIPIHVEGRRDPILNNIETTSVSSTLDDAAEARDNFSTNSLSRRRFGSRKKRISSAYSEAASTSGLSSTTSAADDEEQASGLQRYTSIGKHGEPMFILRKTRPPFAAQKSDSFSSGEDDDFDDDGFREMTAENLFSTLLTRVKSLTRRIHDEHEQDLRWQQNQHIVNHRLNPGNTHARLERTALRSSLKRSGNPSTSGLSRQSSMDSTRQGGELGGGGLMGDMSRFDDGASSVRSFGSSAGGDNAASYLRSSLQRGTATTSTHDISETESLFSAKSNAAAAASTKLTPASAAAKGKQEQDDNVNVKRYDGTSQAEEDLSSNISVTSKQRLRPGYLPPPSHLLDDQSSTSVPEPMSRIEHALSGSSLKSLPTSTSATSIKSLNVINIREDVANNNNNNKNVSEANRNASNNQKNLYRLEDPIKPKEVIPVFKTPAPTLSTSKVEDSTAKKQPQPQRGKSGKPVLIRKVSGKLEFYSPGGGKTTTNDQADTRSSASSSSGFMSPMSQSQDPTASRRLEFGKEGQLSSPPPSTPSLILEREQPLPPSFTASTSSIASMSSNLNASLSPSESLSSVDSKANPYPAPTPFPLPNSPTGSTTTTTSGLSIVQPQRQEAPDVKQSSTLFKPKPSPLVIHRSFGRQQSSTSTTTFPELTPVNSSSSLISSSKSPPPPKTAPTESVSSTSNSNPFQRQVRREPFRPYLSYVEAKENALAKREGPVWSKTGSGTKKLDPTDPRQHLDLESSSNYKSSTSGQAGSSGSGSGPRRTILPYGGAKSDGLLNKHAFISCNVIAAAERRKRDAYSRSSTAELPLEKVMIASSNV